MTSPKSKDAKLNLRLTDALLEKIRKEAYLENVSRSHVVCRALEEHFDKKK